MKNEKQSISAEIGRLVQRIAALRRRLEAIKLGEYTEKWRAESEKKLKEAKAIVDLRKQGLTLSQIGDRIGGVSGQTARNRLLKAERRINGTERAINAKTSIYKAGLSCRAMNIIVRKLENRQNPTLLDVWLLMSKSDLMRLRNAGKMTLIEIQCVLEAAGLQLRPS